MNFHILTLFPDMIMQGLSTSIIGKAVEKDLLSIEAVNIRDYTLDKHKKVDDYPYGGGAGMLMQAQPVYDAWKSIADKTADKKPRTVYLTPQGPTFTQAMAKEFAKEEDLVLLCGHYEGIDERVLEEVVTDYVSIGDYVLTGGELAAMVMVDAISRMVPGVLGNHVSGETESFEGNLLEHPQYSRPEVWMGKSVPEVLLSGNQKKIDAWRKLESARRTKERRPDMYAKYEKLQNCYEQLKKQKLLHIGMLESIARGQAQLIYSKGPNVLLRDLASGLFYLTADSEENGIKMLKLLTEEKTECLVLHQQFMVEPAKRELQLKEFLCCNQAVYTKKEKLPITGLYSFDEKNKNQGAAVIQKLDVTYLEQVMESYRTMDDAAYIKERLEQGHMYGAFVEEKLAGFVGEHQEGSIGMLEVFPEYRGRKIGKALETYMINQTVEMGYTPFGQVVIGNEVSEHLQESLGLYFSKTPVWFLEA